MGRALSFPPIINSREIGEVKSNTRNVLIEVTGTDLRLTSLTLNILATNFYDRGAEVEPVLVTYPYDTPLGRRVAFPHDPAMKFTVPLARFSTGLGEEVAPADVKKQLTSYGYEVSLGRGSVSVLVPPYRDDILHPMDLVEDYAISRGYDSFEPVMPRQSTVGSLSRIELLSDTVRGHLVGAGFQEIMSNILSSHEDLEYAMPEGEKLVEVDNVMSLAYSALRNRIVPSLLSMEAASSKAFYPHRIFEVGDVAVYDQNANMGSRTLLHAGALISHPGANFSEMHSVPRHTLVLPRHGVHARSGGASAVHPGPLRQDRLAWHGTRRDRRAGPLCARTKTDCHAVRCLRTQP